MAQTAALIRTLKSALKSQGKTYADVAKVLKLSEASVKRMFASNSFSLERMDAVCQMLGMEISDLVQMMNSSLRRIEQLSIEQEREITQDLLLLLVTVCIFSNWTIKNITEFYEVSEEQCVAKLLQLDWLEVIDLLPGNRIKLRISPNFKWQENGPIQRFFKEKVGKEYFDTNFSHAGECLAVLNGMLSPQSNAEMQLKMERLAHEFNELARLDAALDFEEREGVTLVMAMRNWEYGLFRHMIREK